MRLPRVRFTVRTMVAVVALSALLLALILPASNTRCGVSVSGQCRNNLCQVALGLILYEAVYQSFPAGTVPNDRLPPERRLSCCTVLP